jgi:LmbE family N-acetylglucosaminyl deacetylase
MEPESTVIVVAAHPDDEVIGLGSRFRQFGSRLRIVHVTDGSPHNLADAHNVGLSNREDYAAIRFEESLCAAAHGGVARSQFLRIGLVDQEAVHDLPHLARMLLTIFTDEHPSLVYTHPYEGGHPDHDATAFAVHAAARLLETAPEIWEFTSYHAGPQGMVTGCFLPDPDREVISHDLSRRQRAIKQAMFDCFRTQQHILSYFDPGLERFRLAPDYDFTAPPHSGQLNYERFDWGTTGRQFRQLAGEALEQLGLKSNHVTHDS